MGKISCLKANCTLCEKAVLIKYNNFGERIYVCSVKEKQHKPISAYDCDDFRCCYCDSDIEMCRTCKKGR